MRFGPYMIRRVRRSGSTSDEKDDAGAAQKDGGVFYRVYRNDPDHVRAHLLFHECDRTGHDLRDRRYLYARPEREKPAALSDDRRSAHDAAQSDDRFARYASIGRRACGRGCPHGAAARLQSRAVLRFGRLAHPGIRSAAQSGGIASVRERADQRQDADRFIR